MDAIMEDKKKKTRCSETQLNYLVDFMMNHSQFGRGKFQGPQGKNLQNDMWGRLAQELNENGPQKTAEQWKKVWKNQKLLTRKKNSEINVIRIKTGNPTPPPTLSEREKKLLSVIGKMSSEGLGFQEGSIGEGNNLENPKPTVIIVENAETDTMADEVHNVEKKTERPSAKDTKKEKFTKEHELFENLVKVNNDGLLAIANALESVATANNNVANALLRINETSKKCVLKKTTDICIS